MHVCKRDGSTIKKIFMVCLWTGLEKKMCSRTLSHEAQNFRPTIPYCNIIRLSVKAIYTTCQAIPKFFQIFF